MSEFLKNLRSGRESQSYPYNTKQSYMGVEKRVSERRRPKNTGMPAQEALASFLHELTPVFKELVKKTVQTQDKMIKIMEQRAEAEAKRAETAQNLFSYLKENGLDTLLQLAQSGGKKKKTPRPIDPQRQKIMQLIGKLRSKGETYDQIALYLEKEKIPTFSGRGQWHAQTVHRLFQDHMLG